MMPATLIPALESLSVLPRQAADEVELFPSFKGGRHTFCESALTHLAMLEAALVELPRAQAHPQFSCLLVCHGITDEVVYEKAHE